MKFTFIDNSLAALDEFKEFGHAKTEIYDTHKAKHHSCCLINCIREYYEIVGNAKNEQTAKAYAYSVEKYSH